MFKELFEAKSFKRKSGKYTSDELKKELLSEGSTSGDTFVKFKDSKAFSKFYNANSDFIDDNESKMDIDFDGFKIWIDDAKLLKKVKGMVNEDYSNI